MTLRETLDIIKEMCANEPNVGFVGVGDVYELNANQDIHYPAMVITQQPHSLIVDEDWYRYHFIVFYIDRLTEDRSNEEQVQSIGISVLHNLVENLEGMGIFTTYDYTFNTFTERFQSLCAGAFVDIQLNVPVEDCEWDNIFEYLYHLFEGRIDGKQDKLTESKYIKIDDNSVIYLTDELPNKIDDNKDAINALQTDLSTLDNNLSTLNDKVSGIEENKANKEDVKRLSNKIDELDEKIADIPNKFKTINGQTIIGEGNIEIHTEGSYSEGDNISIVDGVISVTGLSNYDDSEVRGLISDNTSDISTIKGSITALDEEIEELSSKVKENVLESDFETYTANTKTVLDNKADKEDIPTKVSAFENDKGYLTEHQSLEDYAKKSEIPTDYVNNETYNTYTAETAEKIAEIEAKGYDDSEVRRLISGNTQAIEELDNAKQPKGDYALKNELPDLTNYLDKTFNGTNNINGHLVLGSTAETAFKKVEAIRNSNNQANSASFYVNSDGSAGFFHKAYNGTSATNDAILKFDASGLQFAKGGTRGIIASVYYDVMTSENTYNKTYIDDTIGNIDRILSSI